MEIQVLTWDRFQTVAGSNPYRFTFEQNVVKNKKTINSTLSEQLQNPMGENQRNKGKIDTLKTHIRQLTVLA